jgi:arylsulfatase A-like enzyme
MTRFLGTLALAAAIGAGCSGKDEAEDTQPAGGDSTAGDDGSGGDGSGDDGSGDDGSGDDGDDTAPPVTIDCAPVASGSGVVQFDGDAPTNLLFIGIDTLRRDHIGHYNPDIDSPTDFLDGMMEESVVLNNHRACTNWTYGSVVCLMAAKTGIEMGWAADLASTTGLPTISADEELVVDWFKEAGYHTRFAGTGLFTQESFNVVNHFDYAYPDDLSYAETVTNRIIEQVQAARDKGQPWYVQGHYFDPHIPYDTLPDAYKDEVNALPALSSDYPVNTNWLASGMPGLWDSYDSGTQSLILQHVEAWYRGEIRFTDDQIERLLNTLDDLGALDDTLVVIWTDHGEQFWDHGEWEHGRGLYHEETGAMAFLWSKNIQPAQWDGVTSHTDLVLTIMDAMGMEIPDAISETARVAGTAGDGAVAVSYVVRGDESAIALDRGDKRLLFNWDGDFEYYVADPTEQDNVYDADDADVQAMWECLEPQARELESVVFETMGGTGSYANFPE